MKKRQSGFTIVELAIIVVVIAIIAALGYLAYDRFVAKKGNTSSSDTSQTVSSAKDLPATPEIKTKADLSKANTVLDSVNLDSTSDAQLAELEAEMNKF